MGVDSEPDSPQGRESLIEAAIDLFSRDGFEATSVSAITDAAGVSRGLVRFYFESKEGLRIAAEERVVKTYLESALAGANAKSSEMLEELVESYSGELPRVARFLRRAVLERRPVALTFIRQLIATDGGIAARVYDAFPEEEWLVDPANTVATRLGYLLLAPLFEDLLGRDVFSAEELKLRNRTIRRTYELIRLGLEAEQARNKKS